MPSAFKQTCICREAEEKGRERGWAEGRNHSFTHNFLETEWGCLHKAKNKDKIKNKSTDDGKKRFCCLISCCIKYVGVGVGGGTGMLLFFSFFFSLAKWHEKKNKKMRYFFPTTKISCGTRWGKTRGSAFYPGRWMYRDKKSKPRRKKTNQLQIIESGMSDGIRYRGKMFT